MAKTGRPTKYSEELAYEICDRIVNGESVKSICESEHMPARSTFFKWLDNIPEFADLYARAKEEQADAIFEEVLEIADDARNDWMLRNGDDDTAYQVNGEHIQRSRLRIDARKWMAGKLRPQKYGDTTNLNVKGSFTVNLSGDAEAL